LISLACLISYKPFKYSVDLRHKYEYFVWRCLSSILGTIEWGACFSPQAMPLSRGCSSSGEMNPKNKLTSLHLRMTCLELTLTVLCVILP
jgi:hypothetical protein